MCAAALMFLLTSAYTVDQTEFVVVKRLGKIIDAKKSPGLYFKMPFVDDLKRFDNRIVTLDWEEPAKFITSENKYMLVAQCGNGFTDAQRKDFFEQMKDMDKCNCLTYIPVPSIYKPATKNLA